MKKFSKKLYALNCPNLQSIIEKKYFDAKKINVRNFENGVILPLRDTKLPAINAIYEGGVCDANYNFILGYKRKNTVAYNNYEVIRSYIPKEAPLYVDEDVIFGGVAFSHFGHFLVESFSRLWWVIKNKQFSKKIIFLKNRPFDENKFIKLFLLCGLKRENIIFLERPMKFKNVIVPDQSLMFFDYYTEEFIIPYNEIVKSVTPSNYKKIYLSRTQFEKQDHVNEIYFENFYRNLGYYIVYPEQLDITEQISLVSGADEIVSTMGTISHLAIFCKPNAKLVTFLRSRSNINSAQVMINNARILDFTMVDVTINILPNRYSTNCFYIGPTSSWRSFCKEEYDIDIEDNIISFLNSAESNFGTYLKLWKDTFSKGKEFNKIKNESVFNLIENIDLTLSEELSSYQTQISKEVNVRSDPKKIFDKLKNKIFKFSHYDGSNERNIFLREDLTIISLTGKSYNNESYWNILDGQLVFQSKTNEVTSIYSYLTIEDSTINAIGFFVKNPKIFFKLSSNHDF